MSGHSKWAQIKRQKGATDAKRGLTFTKLSNAISIAVRQGGGIGDPNQNFRLRLAIDAARSANMPKETIERAIQRVLSKQESGVDEVVYEGFAPFGVGVIIEAVTDNKNRTTSEIKNVFEKSGGIMGQPGSVSYQFKQVGRIIIPKGDKTFDDVFLQVIDAGAEDIEEIGDEIFIYTQPSDLGKVQRELKEKNFSIKETELIRKPLTVVEIPEGEQAMKVMTFLEKLEDMDDVQKVYANFEIKQ